MRKRNIRLLVSIVNYRAADLVCEMLRELVSQLDEYNDVVCIVDNQSCDGSETAISEFIKTSKFSNVNFEVSPVNGGFSYGNNEAIRSTIDKYGCDPEYVLLLNPDTRVYADAIDILISFLKRNEKVGIVGSRLESLDGTPQCSAFRFQSLQTEIVSSLRLGVLDRLFPTWRVTSFNVPAKATQVDWVAGASMLIRYDVFRDIGLMDENYFLYFEETDFCLQAKRHGWECWYLPESRVVHFVGQSTGIVSGDALRRRRPKYWFQSRQYYFRKNFGVTYTVLADLLWGVGFTLWRVRRFLQQKEDTDPKYMLRDFWRNSIFFSWMK